jgi:hypothetical protein
MTLRCLAIAAALMLAGCGDDEPTKTASSETTTAAEATATEAAQAAALDEDALFLVHDALSECLRKAEAGLLVQFREGGTVTISNESSKPPKYDDSLGAPEATEKLIGEGAQYVGLRDNGREKGRTPDWDVLIFPSEEEAAAAVPALSDEVGDPAGATQSGRYVTVVLPDAEANGDDPDAADATLAGCQEEAAAAAAG